ncbi:MAG: DUF6152 family protein [Candidatus Rariloculaceae bacterium]
MKFAATALSLLILPTLASSHHSRVEFEAEIQEVQGELIDVAWRNPHPVLTIRVANDAGEDELMLVEGWQSANSMLRKGLTGDVFTTGTTVRAAVQESTRRPQHFLGLSISLGNGSQAILRPGYDPYFPGEAVIGSDDEVAAPQVAAESPQSQGLFKVWSFVERRGVPDPPVTAAAEAKLADFDELGDHPLWNCDPVGMPVAMDTELPIEFLDQGDTILMRIEQNDNMRTIHLNSAIDASSQPETAMGYSVGRWEDSTLIVTTTNSDYPYFDDDGVPKSPDMEFVERFTLSADGLGLSLEATMSDPIYLSRPVTINIRWEWRPEEAIERWNCVVSG